MSEEKKKPAALPPPPSFIQGVRERLGHRRSNKNVHAILQAIREDEAIFDLVIHRIWQAIQTPYLVDMSAVYVKAKKKRLEKQMDGIRGAIHTFEREEKSRPEDVAALRKAFNHLRELHDKLMPLPKKTLGGRDYAGLRQLRRELAEKLKRQIPVAALVELVRASDSAAGHKGKDIRESAVRNGLKRSEKRLAGAVRAEFEVPATDRAS